MAPETVAAVYRAGGAGNQQYPAVVLVDQAGHRVGVALSQRVFAVAGRPVALARQRQHLQQQGVEPVAGLHQADKGPGNPQRKRRLGLQRVGRLRRVEVEGGEQGGHIAKRAGKLFLPGFGLPLF